MATKGKWFSFEGDVEVCITDDHAVLVEDPDNGTRIFEGFPTFEAAEKFVLWGDFEPPSDSAYLQSTGATHGLTMRHIP